MAAHTASSSQYTITEETIAEHRLWTAVVVKAVEDWRLGTMRRRRDAQAFLFENDRDLETLCVRAGLDSTSLREKLLKIGRKLEPHVRFVHAFAV
jgi:hypothetical protein